MRTSSLAPVVMLLLAATAASAQENRSPIGFRFSYATGFTAATQDPMGLSVSLGAELALAPAVGLRLEGMYQEAGFRDIFGMASLKLSPLGARSPFYAVAGLGGYLDDGFNTAWNAGAGMDLGKLTRLPLFVEYRVFFARSEFSALSFGLHF